MPPRREVSTGLRPQPFQPATAPVDTFVQPPQSPLRDLARALAGTSENLRQYASGEADRRKEQDTTRANSDVQRLVASGKSYADAIRDGSISPGESPWYRYAAREGFGRLEASKFTSSLLGQVDQILEESDGNVSFDAVVAQQLAAQGAPAQDEAYRNGFFRNLDNQLANARSRFEARKAEVVEARSVATMSATMYEGLRGALLLNGDLHDAANRQALVSPLRAEGLRMMAVNPRAGQSVNEAMISAVVGLAQENTDPDLLDLLDEIVLPNGAHLSSTVAAREAKGKALAEISQRQGILARARTRQIETRTDAIYGEVLDALGRGETPNWDSYRTELRSFGGDGLAALNELRDRVATSQQQDDPALVETLTRDILLNTGTVTFRTLSRSIGQGITAQTASRLSTMVRATDRYLNEMAPRWKSALSEGRTAAGKLAREQSPGFNFLTSNSAALATRELTLQSRFSEDFFEFYQGNRNANPIAVQKFVNDWVAEQRRATEAPKPDPNNPAPPRPAPVTKEQAQQLLNRVEVDLNDDGMISEALRLQLTAAGVPTNVSSKDEIQHYLIPPSSSPSR